MHFSPITDRTVQCSVHFNQVLQGHREDRITVLKPNSTSDCADCTGLRGFRPGPTLYSHRRWLEACNFRI